MDFGWDSSIGIELKKINAPTNLKRRDIFRLGYCSWIGRLPKPPVQGIRDCYLILFGTSEDFSYEKDHFMASLLDLPKNAIRSVKINALEEVREWYNPKAPLHESLIAYPTEINVRMVATFDVKEFKCLLYNVSPGSGVTQFVVQ